MIARRRFSSARDDELKGILPIALHPLSGAMCERLTNGG